VPLKDDVYGLAQGYNGQHGICVYRATCQTKEGGEGVDRDALVVAVPTAAPFAAVSAQASTYMAHRELGLAGGVLHCLGKDWSAMDEELYFYEAAAGVSLAALLTPERGRRVALGEGGLLFRYWVGRVLRAICEVQTQSTHELLNAGTLGLENVVVAGKGLRLRLGGLRWGPQVSPFAGEAKKALRRRMRALGRSFARIVEGMLGLNSHACWHGAFPNVGDVLAEAALERVAHHRALQGLRLQEGDQVLLQLDAHFRCYTHFRVEMKDKAQAAEPAVAVAWEPAGPAEDVQPVKVWGRARGVGRLLCYYEEVQKGRPEGSPLVIEFEVVGVEMSPRLKAVLQFCNLMSGDDLGFVGKTKQRLEESSWRERVDTLWLQDLLQNQYFRDRSDDDLEAVMCDFEALFDGKKPDTE
jgi:hypothetical protein